MDEGAPRPTSAPRSGLQGEGQHAAQELATVWSLLARAGIGMLTLEGAPGFAIVAADEASARFFGRAAHALTGTPFLHHVQEGERHAVSALFEAAIGGESGEAVCRLVPRGAPPAPYRLVVTRDLTQSSALRAILTPAVIPGRLERAVAEMPRGLVIVDSEDRFCDWNTVGLGLVGEAGERIPGESVARILAACGAARGSGEVRELDVPGDADATLHVSTFPLFDDAGRADHAGVLIEDRTMEADLRAAQGLLERRIGAIFDAIGDAVVVTDRRGRIDAWNPGAQDLYGWSAEETRGRVFAELVEERTEVEVGALSFDRVPEDAGLVGRVRHRHRDGHVLELDVVARGLASADGTVGDRVAVYRPSSVAGELDARILRAERLQALESLAAGIAHEFNNLLGVVLSNLAYLSSRIGSDPDLRETIEQMREAALRGASLTDRMRTFARDVPKSGPRGADLQGVLESLRRLVASERQRGFSVRVTLPAQGEAWVAAEAAALEQVLLNLVLNARDAMDGRGQVEVEVLLHPELGVAEIVVDDDGPGVPQGIRKQIFDPFFTTKAPGEGSGLGLAVAHALVVERWSGEIDISDSPLGGARFVISLPLGRAPTPLPGAPSGPARSSDPGLRKVLVVDDEPAVRAATARLFKLLGAVPTTAENAEEALERIEADPPDLVVLDVVMPETPGDVLYRGIRKLLPDVPVLFVSGYPAGRLGSILEADRRAAFLQKPFELLALASEVRSLMGNDVVTNS
jgi:two-component system cell cycle sensor histidine kinase/response regulator CckA